METLARAGMIMLGRSEGMCILVSIRFACIACVITGLRSQLSAIMFCHIAVIRYCLRVRSNRFARYVTIP